MNTNSSICLIILLALTLRSGFAQEVLDVQSPARPFGMDIIGPVNAAGSDDRAADFQANHLPTFTQFINTRLIEGSALNDISGIALHPNVLNLAYDYDVRTYFLGEGAGYHNTLGFTANQNGVTDNVGKLIFPDASSVNSYLTTADSSSPRTSSAPVLPGDFVDLGTIEAGTQLDFFLISNGANGGTNVYTADDQGNPDRIQHVVSYALSGSPYLLIGFEDLYGGGDLDFNDLVFAVDIGPENIKFLTTPEPSSILVLFSLLLLCTISSHRRFKSVGNIQ